MVSSFGKVDDIQVSRFRQETGGYSPRSLIVFDNEREKFQKRKIRYLTKISFGIPVST